MRWIAAVAVVLLVGCGNDSADLTDPGQAARHDITMVFDGDYGDYWERMHPDVQASTTRQDWLECMTEVQYTGPAPQVEIVNVDDVGDGFSEVETQVAGQTLFLYYLPVDGVQRVADAIPSNDPGCADGLYN